MTPKDRERLAKLLGMLGSDHPGERAAAALHASKALRSLGITWEDVISDGYQAGYDQGYHDAAQMALELHRQQEQELAIARQQMRAGVGGWQEVGTGGMAATECLASGVPWTAWEKQFLEDMQFRHTMSEKQEAIVSKLYAKMGYYRSRRR